MPLWSAEPGEPSRTRGGDLRRFDTPPHPCAAGLDGHARPLGPRSLPPAGGEAGAPASARGPSAVSPARRALPDRSGRLRRRPRDRGPGWPAAWAREGRLCVLGQAWPRPASHGGTAHPDTLDVQQMAVWLRGGMRPQAAVEPADLRASRDRRRRMHLRHQRAAGLGPIHPTTRQDHRPASGKTLADQAHRAGGAAKPRCPRGPDGVSSGRLGPGGLPSVHTPHGVREVAGAPACARSGCAGRGCSARTLARRVKRPSAQTPYPLSRPRGGARRTGSGRDGERHGRDTWAAPPNPGPHGRPGSMPAPH